MRIRTNNPNRNSVALIKGPKTYPDSARMYAGANKAAHTLFDIFAIKASISASSTFSSHRPTFIDILPFIPFNMSAAATPAAIAAAALASVAEGPSGSTRGAASRGSRAKGKGRAGGRVGGGGTPRGGTDDGGGSGPASIASTALGARPLRNQIPRPFFAFCVKCVAEAALRTPADAVPEIKCNWDCVNSVTCALCKKDNKTCF